MKGVIKMVDEKKVKFISRLVSNSPNLMHIKKFFLLLNQELNPGCICEIFRTSILDHDEWGWRCRTYYKGKEKFEVPMYESEVKRMMSVKRLTGSEFDDVVVISNMHSPRIGRRIFY